MAACASCGFAWRRFDRHEVVDLGTTIAHRIRLIQDAPRIIGSRLRVRD